MALEELSRRVDQLSREVATTRNAIETMEAEIVEVRRRRQYSLDQLGTDLEGRPLAPGPLVWGLVGGMAALVALFLTYLTGLITLQHSQPDSKAWLAFLLDVAAIALAGFTLPYSARPGAGGSARAVLRPMIYALIGICVVALAVVVMIRRPW